MTRIQVKAVTEGGTKNDSSVIKKSVETVDGVKYSAFKTSNKGPLPGYDLIITGAILDVDTYVSGKYQNITAARATDATPAEKQQVAKAVEVHKESSLSDREKNSYIVRESCLSSAVAFAPLIGEETPEGVIAIAQKFETWVLTGKTPSPTVTPPQTPPAVPPLSSEGQPKEAVPFWKHLENIGQLLTRANQRNIKVTEVWSDLGVKASKDIADPDVAWAIIAQKRNLKPENKS